MVNILSLIPQEFVVSPMDFLMCVLATSGATTASVIYIKDQRSLTAKLDAHHAESQSKLADNRTVLENILKDHIANEDKQFHILGEGQRILQELVSRVYDDMKTYKVINHDALGNELEKINTVIYNSCASVVHILSSALIAHRHGTEHLKEDVLHEIIQDIEKDRRKYHDELTIDGVATRTIAIWEETESELFKGFLFWITQFWNKFIAIPGNGNADERIKAEADNLKYRMYNEFMKVFKSKLSIISGGTQPPSLII